MPLNSEPLGSNNTLLNLLNVIIVLAVIIVLIVLLIRFLGRRNQTFMSGRSIRTLGAVGLGPNKSMQVIELGSSLYLIGIGENISILDKVTDPDEVALIIAAFEDQSSNQNNFLAPLIAKVKVKLRGEVPSEEIELSETSSFYETLQSKLRSAPERKEKMEELFRDDATKDESRNL
ncbi:flagellar protein [Paenibacillus odorifer]|uniref:Flagellar protein n=1 Tax=Paenibacillus odorifer TaxID=189426 RepID=A0A1R0ZE62_9BACL|nr:flagellar biosynthetic protein FliO [Paenibacillus odorifer]OMD40399.1 flagellar protein [Paenibacillus odorifer]OME68076.1 flagellar protein [Paenibacillus odorifer]